MTFKHCCVQLVVIKESVRPIELTTKTCNKLKGEYGGKGLNHFLKLQRYSITIYCDITTHNKVLIVECSYSALSVYRGHISLNISRKTIHSSPVKSRYGVSFLFAKSGRSVQDISKFISVDVPYHSHVLWNLTVHIKELKSNGNILHLRLSPNLENRSCKGSWLYLLSFKTN